MESSRRVWVLGSAALIVGAALCISLLSPQVPHKSELTPNYTLSVAGTPVEVAIVDTPELRARGLSGYSGLRSGEGILFFFDEEGIYPFWMKDMLFSIDIVWIAGDGKIVHMEKGVTPNSFPRTFASDVPAKYVLEVPAGFTDAHDIYEGSVVTF